MIRTRNVPAAEAERIPALRPVDHVVIEIADRGRGMAPEVLDRAFEPFFTTKAVGEGTGLGLSQVFGFAKQSEGHVEIESELGRGTTVWIYLPRDRTELSSPHPSEEAPRLGRTPRMGYA